MIFRKRNIILVLLCILAACVGKEKQVEVRDLDEIKESGEIKAVTLYNSTSYFHYKEDTLGYEYELIKDFANTQGLKLSVIIAKDSEELIEIIKNGDADVAAYPVFISNELQEEVLFCGHEELTYQVLVQRNNLGDTLLRDVTNLIGKDIHIRANTKYSQRIKNLNAEIGGGINIHEITNDTITTEDLIEMVSKGEIAYTVSDDNIAKLNKTYFWNIDIRMPISFKQRSSWIVNKNCTQLAEAINEWASNTEGERTYKATVKRYFELSKRSDEEDIITIGVGQISPYDDIFAKYAPEIGWDWQLLASIAYQESKFHTNLRSWAGAEGLMGIMPNTARSFGADPQELRDPEMSIKIAVKYIKSSQKAFTRIEDPIEKIKFILAAYNSGVGHVNDAQRLTSHFGKDPYIWDNNVAEYARLKSEPEYYNNPVCKHGYLRGSETFNYVKEVLERYHRYKGN